MAQESGHLVTFNDVSQLCALTVPGIDTIGVRVYSCSDSSLVTEIPCSRKDSPSSLCWAPSKNVRRAGGALSDQLLGIGSNSGSIVVYSPAEDKTLVSLSNGHNSPVSDIKFDPLNRSILWSSSSKDGKLIRWDLSSGTATGKFSLKDRSIQKVLPFIVDSDAYLAAASHCLYVIPPDSLAQDSGVLHPDLTFPGHTTQIQSLIKADYNGNTFLVSCAESDRFINIYSLSKRSVSAVLPAQSDVSNIAISNDGLLLAASTSDGIVEIFERPFAASKSPSSRRKSNLARPSTSQVQFEMAGKLFPVADISFDGSILIASWRDRGSLYSFERVILRDNEDQLISEIKVSIKSRPTALASAALEAGNRELYNEAQAIVTEGANMEDVEFSEAGPLVPPSEGESELDEDFIPLSGNEDTAAEPTLEEQLLASSAIDAIQKPKRLPKSGTVATVLSQALQTNDQVLLESCLQNRDPALIAKTVQRMEPSLAVALLSHLAAKISRTPTRTSHLNTWIKWTLITHAGRISPKDIKALSVLHATLETRAKTLPRLLDIQGRLELLSSQMDLRKTVLNGALQGASDSDNDQFIVEYTEDGYESISD